MTIHYFTHIGPGHFEHNQDAVLVDEAIYCDRSFETIEKKEIPEHAPCLCAVADGISAHRKSHIASCRALKYLSAFRKEAAEFSPVSFIRKIQDRFFLDSLERRDLHGASTTLAGVYVADGRAKIFHCGDSRVYLFRNGQLTSLTRDHTQLESMHERGEIDDTEYRTAADLYQVLESYLVFGDLDADEIRIDTRVIELSENDVLLIVTDGVTDTIGDDEMESLFVGSKSDMEFSKRLKSILLKYSEDNFSFIVVD